MTNKTVKQQPKPNTNTNTNNDELNKIKESIKKTNDNVSKLVEVINQIIEIKWMQGVRQRDLPLIDLGE